MITKNAKEDSANKERRSIMCKLTWGGIGGINLVAVGCVYRIHMVDKSFF